MKHVACTDCDYLKGTYCENYKFYPTLPEEPFGICGMKKQTFLLKNKDTGKQCVDFIREKYLEAQKEHKRIQVTVGPEQRTKDQNSLLWKIHTQWCVHFNQNSEIKLTPEEWHYEFFIPMFCEKEGDIEVTTPDGEVIKKPIYRTSSEQDIGEMTDILERYIAYCTERGCELEVM